MSRKRKFDWSVEHDSANRLALTLKIGDDAIPLAAQDDLADAHALRVQASILIGDLIDAMAGSLPTSSTDGWTTRQPSASPPTRSLPTPYGRSPCP